MNDLTRYEEEGAVQRMADVAPGNLAISIKTEIETMLENAARRPRSLTRAQSNILSMATLDPQAADECIYALPRGNKPIRGASIRLAEIIASQYGNCHYGGRVVKVDRDERVVTAEGVFIDYETGLRVTRQAQRRLTDRNGRLLSEDMIVVTGNAAISIAIRNAILSGVPKPVWRKAYEACEQVLAGGAKTIVQRRDEVFKSFAAFGVTPEMIYEVLEIEGEEDLDLEEIKTLRAMYGAIHREEYAPEDYFPQLREARRKPGEKRKEAPKGAKEKLEDLVDEKPGGVSGPESGADGQKEAPAPTAPEDSDPAAGGAESAPEAPEEPNSPAAEQTGTGEEAGGGPSLTAPGDPSETTEDAIEAARERGRQANRNRMPLRAMPEDLAGNDALEKAFRDGWNEADKAK